MKEELASIDVSSIEDLQRIKAEQDVVLDRLKKMDEKKQSVSEEVFRRVRIDYECRLTDLDREAGPLKDKARAQYAELKRVLDAIGGALSAAKLDREELVLRHELGEFDDEGFAARIKQQDAKVKGHQDDLADAEVLKGRFLSAFHSEDDLERAPEKPPAAKKPPAAASTELGKTAPLAVGKAVKGETPPVPPKLDKTTAIPLAAEPAAQPPVGATVILKWPKLLVHFGSGRVGEHTLVGAENILGSGGDCTIVIEGKKVSPKHASIAMGPNGHVIRDLKSQVGTLVNGVEITERELASGDIIQLGEVKMTFTA